MLTLDLGADATIALDQSDEDLTAAFVREDSNKHFDIVLDYVWGHPTEVLLDSLTRHDVKAESSRIRLIEIGENGWPDYLAPGCCVAQFLNGDLWQRRRQYST